MWCYRSPKLGPSQSSDTRLPKHGQESQVCLNSPMSGNLMLWHRSAPHHSATFLLGWSEGTLSGLRDQTTCPSAVSHNWHFFPQLVCAVHANTHSSTRQVHGWGSARQHQHAAKRAHGLFVSVTGLQCMRLVSKTLMGLDIQVLSQKLVAYTRVLYNDTKSICGSMASLFTSTACTRAQLLFDTRCGSTRGCARKAVPALLLDAPQAIILSANSNQHSPWPDCL